MGPALSGGMGPAPITNEELLAWQYNTFGSIQLFPWESRYIIRLSRAWCAESERAREPLALRPERDGDEQVAVRAARSMRDDIRRMAS